MSLAPIVLATYHEGEQAELAAWLESLGRTPLLPPPGVMVDHGGATHREQAGLRAEAFAAAAGGPVIAIATALQVYALVHGPGLKTHTLAGPGASDAEHRAKLLKLLERTPPGQRIALFQGAVALAVPGHPVRITASTLECEVTRAERGEGGVHYDPVIQVQDRRTLAEMPAEDRQRLGHRGMAMTQMRKWLVG